MKGVNEQGASPTPRIGYYGWYLMVKTDSKITKVSELAGKKVGITSAGSGTDMLARWTHAGPQDQLHHACRSAAAAWCRTCCPATSTPSCCTRRCTYKVMEEKQARR